MRTISRRQALALGGSAIIAATGSLSAKAGIALPIAPTPAWVVGTPGEFDWTFVRAPNADAAKLGFVSDWCGLDACAAGAPAECDCEFCCKLSDADVTRMERWDALDREPTPGDWLRSGLGHICDRCGYETCGDGDGHAVGDKAICEECMTLADWEIVDPEHAAEMRAELAELDA